MKRLFSLATLALAGLLGACSILPKAEPLDVYLLPAQATPSATRQASVPWSLRVHKPVSNQLLDSTRIAVVPDGDRISAYQGARWNDRAPLLVRDRLIEAFQHDGQVAAVSSDDSHLHADLELVTGLRAFQSEYRNGQPQVHILLDARLVQGSTRRILASQRFDVQQPTTDDSVGAVVRAFGLATDRLGKQVVSWSLQQAPRP